MRLATLLKIDSFLGGPSALRFRQTINVQIFALFVCKSALKTLVSAEFRVILLKGAILL